MREGLVGHCHTTTRTDFDRHLVRSTTNATRLHLDGRGDVAQGLLDKLHRLTMLFADVLEGAVNNSFGNGLLTGLHHHIDEAGNQLASVLRVREDHTGGMGTFTRHNSCPLLSSSGAWRRTSSATCDAWSRRRSRDCREPCGNAHPGDP